MDGFFTIKFWKKEKRSTSDEISENNGEKDLEKDLGKDLENFLSQNQKKVIDAIRRNKNITQLELSVIVGINEKNIRNNIAKLKEKGFLERIGPDKGGYWKVLK